MGINTSTAPFSLTDGSIKLAKLNTEVSNELPAKGNKVYYYDFSRNAIDATQWTSAVVSGTNTATITDQGGYIVSTSTATGSRSATMGAVNGFKTGSNTTTIVEILWRYTAPAAPSTDASWYVGVSSAPQPVFPASSVGIGFQGDSLADDWAFYSKDATTFQKDVTLAQPTINVWHVIKFVLTATSCICYIDGVQYGTTHTTRVPVTTTALYPFWSVSNGTIAEADIMEVKSVKVELIP